MIYNVCYIKILSFIFCLNSFCLAQNEAILLNIDDYRNNFQSQWNKYLHSLGNVEGSIIYKNTRNGKVESNFTNKFICAYPLLADIRGDNGKEIEASVNGNKYHFKLDRKSPSDGWIVTYISNDFSGRHCKTWDFPTHFSEPPSHLINPIGYNIFNTLGVGLFGMDVNPNLPCMFASNWFSVDEFFQIEKDGEKQIYLSFQYNMPENPKEIPNLPNFAEHPEWKKYTLKGKVYLTTDFFLISEGNFNIKWMSEEYDVQVKIDYDKNIYQVPLPRTYYKKTIYRANVRNQILKGIFETDQEFDLRETNPKDLKRFTLSYYGLPEPDFGERRTNRVRYIIMGIGILMMVIGTWRIIQKRRTRF
jgi:hypothetical protein